MPKFFFTTNDSNFVDVDEEGTELRDDQAAFDEAQRVLAEMVREKLPNGPNADFAVIVRNQAGHEIYRALLRFDATKPDNPDGTRSGGNAH